MLCNSYITTGFIIILLQDNDLYEAVKKQHDVFESKLLLNNGANPNKKHGWVSYHIHTQ